MTDRTTPFLRDVPLGEAQAAWRRCRASADGPARVPPVRLAVGEALGRVIAEPTWARWSSPPFDSAAMDGIAVRAADTVGASESTPLLMPENTFAVVDTGDPLPEQLTPW
jgi:putative molybdopterin biosynthesis protein